MSDPTEKELSRIRALLKANPRGMSITDISRELGLNRNSVAKYLNMLLVSGHAEMRTVAAAKVYYPSQRVPISAMLDFSSDCILTLDNNLRVVQANDSFLEYMQTVRDDIIGKPLQSLPFPAQLNPTLQKAIDEAMKGNEQTCETTAQVNGDTHHHRVKIIPTVFEEGDPGLTILQEDITEQRKAHEALQKSEARYKAIIEDQTEYIIRFTPDLNVTFINEAYARHLGRPKEDFLATSVSSIIPGDEQSPLPKRIGRMSGDNPVIQWETSTNTFTNEEHWYQWIVRGIFDEQGRQIEYQAVGRDITDLKRSIREKEVLLQEVHQRVNNSLQLISSLLHLQDLTIRHDEGHTIIQDMQNRIHSLSLVYETLYQSHDLSRIDLGRYLRKVAEDLLVNRENARERIRLNVVSDTILETDQAIPCGLIATELLQNALCHAFPGGRNGEVTISLRSVDGRCIFTISDNGEDLPESADTRTTESFSQSLVRTLVTRQLEGDITVERSGGTTYLITFPQPGQAGE